METTLAIDFGTTNSTVYYWNNNTAVKLWNRDVQGSYLFPSIVAYSGNSIIVGDAAKQKIGRPETFVVSCVKRLIGLTYDSYIGMEKKDIFGCDIVRGDDGYPYFVISADGSRTVSCIDVACELFKWLKANAEAVAGREFTHAYVTRPANFRENQVSAIREAARKAGLTVDKMISEPSAAAISWCFKEDKKWIGSNLRPYSTVLVIDFGGGTLDLSIVRYLNHSQFRVIDSAGDPNLGGNDIDVAIQEFVLNKLDKMNLKPDLTGRHAKRNLRLLKKACEEFKILINGHLREADDEDDFFEVNKRITESLDISYFGLEDQYGEQVTSIDLTVREFYEAIKGCLDRYLVPLTKITRKPEQMVGTIRSVLLVGGSSLLKCIPFKLYSKGFSPRQFRKVDAMHCVSAGALQLIRLYNHGGNRKWTETLTFSYGIQSGDNEVCLLLMKGATVPCCSAEKTFFNLEDYPEYIYSKIYQYSEDTNGSSVPVADCERVWDLRFLNPPECRRQKQTQALTIQFKMDVGGVLEVICKDRDSGKLLHREQCNVLYGYSCLFEIEIFLQFKNKRKFGSFNFSSQLMKRERKKESPASNKRSKQTDGKKKRERTDSAVSAKESDLRKEEENLAKLVVASNAKQVEKGNHILFHDIPAKIEELSEYIDSEPLFHLSFEELRNEICIDQQEYIERAKKIQKEVIGYTKESRKVFDKWRKKNQQVCSEIIKAAQSGNSKSSKEKHPKMEIVYNSSFEFPLNDKLVALSEKLHEQIRSALPLFKQIQLWIMLRVPRVEDGNNFGVSVQRDCISEIDEAVDLLEFMLDNMTSYYKLRGAAAGAMINNVQIKDFVQGLCEIDEANFYILKLFFKTLRNSYATIYDTLLKNYDKIQNPRSSGIIPSTFF